MIRPLSPTEAPLAAEIYQLCAREMNAHGFYNWSERYPSVREASSDACAGTLYGYFHHDALCGVVTLDQNEVPQYASLPFCVPCQEALTTHRLAVTCPCWPCGRSLFR